MTKKSPAQLLHDLGQSVWMDTISDGLIQSGELASLIQAGSVYGVTSNPTIFRKAIGSGQFSYPAEIARMAGAGASPEDIYDELSIRDIVRTADLLAETFHSGTGRDGFVSLEVPPALAHDTKPTITEAKRLWAKVGRPNLFVKVPATKEGIPAFETLIAEGVSINVTLVFSRAQYAQVAEAYRRGISRRLAAGKSIEGLHSVASLFVSRLDTSVDKELESRGASESDPARRERLLSLRGAAAVANALDIWEEYRAQFFTPAFDPLRKRGARPQWLLWASTSAKNPAYSDLKYVEELAGPDTINTMPHETLAALLDHGRIEGDRLTPSVEPARETRRTLADHGISLDAHCARLLDDGVGSFASSFDEMMAVIRERATALATRR